MKTRYRRVEVMNFKDFHAFLNFYSYNWLFRHVWNKNGTKMDTLSKFPELVNPFLNFLLTFWQGPRIFFFKTNFNFSNKNLTYPLVRAGLFEEDLTEQKSVVIKNKLCHFIVKILQCNRCNTTVKLFHWLKVLDNRNVSIRCESISMENDWFPNPSFKNVESGFLRKK